MNDGIADRSSKVPALRFPEFSDVWSERKLSNVARFSKGKGISKADIAPNGQTECIRYGELYTTYGELIDQIVSRTNLADGDLVFSEANDVIIPASGETPIDIATASCVRRAGVALSGDINIIRSPLNGVFLAYYLNNKRKHDIARLSQGISVVHLYASQLRALKICEPKQAEQRKIADFLTAVDGRNQSLTKKKDLLEKYKKGVMQQLFNQKVRFTKDNGAPFPDWEEKKLSELLYEHKVRNYEGKFDKSDVLSVSGDLGIVNQIEHLGRSYAGESIDNYHVVHTGDIVYTKSPLKSNPYGIIKANTGKAGIVSTLYAVYSCKETAVPEYLNYYFQLDDNTNRYLRSLVHKGAKNDMKINNQRVLIDPIFIPHPEEQKKIANFLSSIDDKIKTVSAQITAVQAFKKGLLQKMFV